MVESKKRLFTQSHMLYLAPAKLNLFLRVVAKRSDGYHRLQSVFQMVGLYDRLFFRRREDGVLRLYCNEAQLCTDDNLVLKAACLLQQRFNVQWGADIYLHKFIPVGGGMGGGSSDAAAALMGLNRLWALQIPKAELQALALNLGADVPFFVFGRTAWVQGIGEQLQAFCGGFSWFLLLFPPVFVSTARVFAHAQFDFSKAHGHQDISTQLWQNDLQSVVFHLYPEVKRYFDWLTEFGPAVITGSGSVVFLAFQRYKEARAVLARCPQGWSARVVPGLYCHPQLSLNG